MSFSGFITHDERLRAELLELFASFKIKPENPEKLAHLLLNEKWYYEKHREIAKDEPSAGEHREKMDRFISALQAARRAWLDLPSIAHEVMHQNMPYTGSSLLPPTLLEQLQHARFWEQAPLLPDWRKPGLGKMQKWGADIEMLDLLQALAKHWMETTAPEPYARNKLEPGYIRAIADICEDHGIKKIPSEGGQLVKVVRVMLHDWEREREEDRKRRGKGGEETDYCQLIKRAISPGA